MSAKLRRDLWNEINTNWTRTKGYSASRGGEYFNTGEVRIVKSQFDGKMQAILNKKYGAHAMSEIPVVDTDFQKLRKHIAEHMIAVDQNSNAWELGKTHRSKGNATLIAISYVRSLTKKGTPRKGNIEQAVQKEVKNAIKSYLEVNGLEVTNMEYEHGARRESQFKGIAPGADLFNRKEAYTGAQGTNAEQVSYMELDKFIRQDGAKYITKDKRLLGSVNKTLTFGLDEIFGISTKLSKERSEKGLRDTLIMQGEVVPVEEKDNPGTVDSIIKNQVELLLKDQATFVRKAVESGAKKDPDTAEKLFTDSPGPLESLYSLAPKQIIERMFPHKVNPDMRLRINKNLLLKGKSATTKGTSTAKSKTKAARFRKKVVAAGMASKGRGARSHQTMRTGQNPMALRNLLNEILPEIVAQNMIAPALQFRTGRFANSVRVDNITQGPRGGNTMIEASYRNDPYETFAPGGRKYTAQRDPERLIKRSIRQAASGLVGARFGIEIQ